MKKKTDIWKRTLGLIVPVVLLMFIVACGDDDDNGGTDPGSDSDTDTDTDSDVDTGPIDIDDMCNNYPEPDNTFDGLQEDDDGNLIPQSGSVITNYTLWDKDDNEFEICELAEDYDLLLLLITRFQ